MKLINESVRYIFFSLATIFPALLIMDIFRGQMTEDVLYLLKQHNILLVCACKYDSLVSTHGFNGKRLL